MKRLNSAGRFWLSYLFILLAGLVYSVHSHAGYYATVTSRGPATLYYLNFALNSSSPCMLTPSMAITHLSGGGTSFYVVTQLTNTGQWTIFQPNGDGGTASGTYAECTAVPMGGAIPNFVGGVTDPAISGDSVLSASGGSSGGSIGSIEEMEALFGWNEELFNMAVGASLLVFVIGFGVGLIVNTVRKARNF